MTWLKLSDDFADDLARGHVSDRAFRTHVEGLLWTMRRETDGLIDAQDVRRFAEATDPDAAIVELVSLGHWQALADGSWQIVHHMNHQPDAATIEKRRNANAERQKLYRKNNSSSPAKPSKSQDCKRCEGGGWVLAVDGSDYERDADDNTIKCYHR
ncbi:hypothetical protein [uncultured Jatrophihabitans sp.]|uniref:hypothetical protein n=1 Tax=uncultured Jatrophihabitans sp. TaxID=1610747 RepID=UPI0035CAFB91